MCVPFLTSELSQAFIQIEAIRGEVSPPLSPVSPLCPNDSSGTWPNHLQRLQEFTSNPCWITRGEDCGSRPRNHLRPDGVKNQQARLQGQVRIQSVKVLSHPGGPGSNPESCLSDWMLLWGSRSNEDRQVCKTTQIIRSTGRSCNNPNPCHTTCVRPQLATRVAQTHSVCPFQTTLPRRFRVSWRRQRLCVCRL